MVHQDALDALGRGGAQQGVGLGGRAVTGGQDHLRPLGQVVQQGLHLGQQGALFIQIADGRLGDALLAAADEGLVGVGLDVVGRGNGGHGHELHAHAAGGVHRLEVDAALGVVQHDLAEDPGGILRLTEVLLHDLGAHHGGEVMILDDEAPVALGSGVLIDLQRVHAAFGDGGPCMDMQVAEPLNGSFKRHSTILLTLYLLILPDRAGWGAKS